MHSLSSCECLLTNDMQIKTSHTKEKNNGYKEAELYNNVKYVSLLGHFQNIGRAFFFLLKIPEIYWKLSTKRVLTMEFCDGGKVDDLPYMKAHKISSNEVSKEFCCTINRGNQTN